MRRFEAFAVVAGRALIKETGNVAYIGLFLAAADHVPLAVEG